MGEVNLGQGVFSLTPSVLQVTASMTNSRPINLHYTFTPAELIVDPGVTLTQTGIIGGGSGLPEHLNKKGSGTLILAAFNTYRGNTNLLEGTIRLGLSNQIRDQSWVLVEAGTTLDLDNNSESVASLRGIGGTVDTGGPLGRLTVVGDQFGTFFWGGDITGSGGFTKAGFHTLEITTPQSFTGRTVTSNGELRFGSDGAFADDSDITIDSPGGWNLNGQDDRVDSIQGDGIVFLGGAKLVVDEAGTGTRLFGGGLGGAGNFVKAGTHTLVLSGINMVTGTTTLEAGVLQVASSAHLGDGTVVFDGGTLRSTASLTNTRPVNVNASQTGMVDVNAGTTFTQAEAITGSGSTTLTKRGEGTLRTTVPFASGFQGDIRIEAGTFDLAGTGNAIGNSTRVTVNQPGTFLVNNPDDIGSIAGNGSIVLNEILRVGLDDTSSTFAGVISGSGLFGKRGTGTMTLAGENSYSGITEIDNGILKLTGNDRLSDATDLEISAGATLLLEGVVDSIDSISGAGSIQLGAPFTTTFNVLTIGTQNGTAHFSGSISSNLIGAGQLVKAGLGTQTLTGHSTHPNTTVQSGTLILSEGGSIDQLGLSIGNGAALLATAIADGNATTWQLAADLDVGRFSPGRLEMKNGAVVTVDGDVNIGSGAEEGTLILDNGVLDNSSGNGIRIAKGSLQGSGAVLGNLVNKDTVSPGLSAGVLNLTGDFFQTDVGTLAIEIAGIDNSNLLDPQFDVLAIRGEAELAGLFEVSLLDSFLPSSGETFAILTASAGINGTFNAAALPKLPKGLDWSINYAADKVLLEVLTLLATDTEPDGDVDGADFLALQRDNPVLIPTWQTEYGSGGNLLAASQQVPEPNGLLLIAGLIGLPGLRRPTRV